MKKSTIILLVAGLVILFFCGGACSSYNGLVDADQAVQKQWGQVENQYQRRADLIPNLVATVKGYAAHEQTTLENVTNARAGVAQAQEALEQAQAATQAMTPEEARSNPAQYQALQRSLSGALGIYVNAVREAYPDLKANQNFLDMQAQLEGTENRIATERRAYNDAVETYNKKVLRFPGNIFASIFGFDSKEMFRAEEGAQTAPKVEF